MAGRVMYLTEDEFINNRGTGNRLFLVWFPVSFRIQRKRFIEEGGSINHTIEIKKNLVLMN